ncbi:hypothetical protein QYE76_012762 [Lolium multiflorum]|uniref:CCHC-type domain-containing protein n=1 Tax=Lolium multiflorum TaxID=4521 RepID=A0AAD8X595_LOLMU|nr:hypothetical protein QYE76_012762 [Lolium multiflorum]
MVASSAPPAPGAGPGRDWSWSEPTTGRGLCQGRFWVLAGEEEETAESVSSVEEPGDLGEDAAAGSPPRRPAASISLDGFIQRAEELGGSLRHGRRRAFAPGGRSSRFPHTTTPRFRRLGDVGDRGLRRRSSTPVRRGSPVGDSLVLGEVASTSTAEAGIAAVAAEEDARSQLPLAWPWLTSGPAGGAGPRLAHVSVGCGLEPTTAAPEVELVSFPTGWEGGSLAHWDREASQPLGPVGPPGSLPTKRASPGTTTSLPFVCGRGHGPWLRVYDDGRKRRFEGGARRQEGGGRGDGAWREGGGARHEGNNNNYRGRFDGGGGRQEGGYRYQDPGGMRQDGGSHFHGEDLRSTERGDDRWGPPPPWWEEQQKREEALRARELQSQGQSARGLGEWAGAGGQGDRSGAPPRLHHQQQPQAKAKGKKVMGQGAGAGPGQPKGKNKASVAKAGAPAAGECFKCGREGHYQSECTFEPLCVVCSGEGHASANCPSKGNSLRLQSMGHAISGGGFFNIDVEPLQGASFLGEVSAAVIRFDSSPLSEEQLSDKLKHLVDEMWDWQVCRLSDTEFSVVFLSRETMRLSTGSGKLHIPLSKRDTAIREAFLSPKPSLVLPSTWVRLTGVPENLLSKERMRAAFVMVGCMTDLDELSVHKRDREPIRARFQCRYPDRIKGSVQVFVNGEVYTVGVQAEAPPRGGAGGSGGAPPPPPRKDTEDDLSDEYSTDDEWKHGRRRKNQEPEQNNSGQQQSKGGAAGPPGAKACDKEMGSQSAPPATRGLEALDLPIFQYGSNLGRDGLEWTKSQEDMSVGGEKGVEQPREEWELSLLSADDSRLSTETVSLVIDPLQLPAVDSPQEGPPTKLARRDLSLGEKEMGEVALKGRELVMETVPGGAILAAWGGSGVYALHRDPQECKIRGGKTGTSTIVKAQCLAAEKNLEGKCKESGTSAEVLGFLSDSHLSEVILDSGMVFRPSAGTQAEALSIIRAKEMVQAALAATTRRLELEAEARSAQAQTEAMGVSVGVAGDIDLPPSGEVLAANGDTETTVAPRVGSPGVGPDLGREASAGTPHRSPAQLRDGEAQGAKPRKRRGRKSTLTVRKGSSKRKAAP